MDGSWSVGRENFKHIRSFIASLAGAFDIGEDKTRVAVVQYSTDTRTEFPLTRYNRRGDLLQAINSLPYKGGNTMTGKMFWIRGTCFRRRQFVLIVVAECKILSSPLHQYLSFTSVRYFDSFPWDDNETQLFILDYREFILLLFCQKQFSPSAVLTRVASAFSNEYDIDICLLISQARCFLA